MTEIRRLPVVGRDLPEVPECYGLEKKGLPHHLTGGGYAPSCSQCDGRHRHEWTECLVPPSMEHARRCRLCGGRQCDAECVERRHHRGPHMAPDGTLRPVGK